jgi:hypothetical protein
MYSENDETPKKVNVSETADDFKEYLDGRAKERNTNPHIRLEESADFARKWALWILEHHDPLVYILDVFGTLHVGDREIGEGIALGTGAQSVENSLGLQSKLTGDSGKGKSDAAKKMMHLHAQEYVLYSSLTDMAIWYLNIKPGSTIFSDDVNISKEFERLVKNCTSNFQRKTTRILPIKDKAGNYIANEQEIPERLNFLFTSVRTAGSDELIKRQMGYDVDTSDAQDKLYIEFEKERAKKATPELPINDDVLICREIVRIIKENDDGTPRILGVDIPFSDRIEWTDYENRRNFNMFMDMIRSFAMFRFMQRERSAEGSIIATEADFNDAKRHYAARASMQALHLDDAQTKFCKHLAALGGEADTQMMQAAMKISRKAVYAIAEGLGAIYWRFSSEKRSVPVDDSESTKHSKRYYILNYEGDTFKLDEYDSVVHLKSETEQ